VTGKVKEEAERVDHAIHTMMDRIDGTADRLRSNVRGLRVANEVMLHSRRRAHDT
jgi:hypothetical protein